MRETSLVSKRNLKSLNNKTGEKIKAKIEKLLDNHDRYKKCYFWSNTGSASSRRSQEFCHNLHFLYNGKEYHCTQELSISCKNFYYGFPIYVDGEKKNIRSLKSLL